MASVKVTEKTIAEQVAEEAYTLVVQDVDGVPSLLRAKLKDAVEAGIGDKIVVDPLAVSLSWEKGSIWSNNGSNNDNMSRRSRTPGFFDLSGVKEVTISISEQKYYMYFYRPDRSFISSDGWHEEGQTITVDPSWGYMRLAVSNLDESKSVLPENVTLTMTAAMWAARAIRELSEHGGGGGEGVSLDRTLTDPYKAAPADLVGGVRNALNGKQDKLVAGNGISIAEDGKTISSTGGGVELDRTLTREDAAAPADLVGTLKNNVGDLTGLSTTDKSSVVAAINEAAQSGGVEIDPTLKATDKAAPADVVGKLSEDIDAHNARITTLENMQDLHRYGVTGIGLANTQLTRLYDAVGMTAQVGTDDDNSNVINNFDDVAPFNRRKCVGEWRLYEGKPVFHVSAYYGDPDYTEDGSMGDYVAVDCTPAYYMHDQENGTLVISAHHYDGYRPFDCLMDRTTGECRPHTYLPCYALAVKDGHAVSLPGLRNEQGDYKKLFDTCKTAANDAASQAILMPIAVNFYEWAMFTVEFATTNCQSIMQGCAALRHGSDDLIVMSSATEGIIQNHQAARVVGECVSIQPTNIDINNVAWLASHRIASIERCNQDGTPNTSGAYNHVTFEVLDDTRTIDAGTEYRFAARPYNTGDCNSVSTPSGSPVSNTDGYHPMKYRWRENVYGNQYQTVADLMNFAVLQEGYANVNEKYAAKLQWLYHRDPETITPKNYANSAAGREDMLSIGWEILDTETPAEHYATGYIKSRAHSNKYPDIWRPEITEGGSASTYFADYAFPVTSHLLRAVRLGGYWYNGSHVGFSSVFAYNAPSYGSAHYGGGLYYPQ